MCYYPEFNFQSWPILKPGGSSWRLVFGGQKSHRFGTMGSPTPSPMIRFLLLPRYFWGSASYFFPDPGLAKIIFFWFIIRLLWSPPSEPRQIPPWFNIRFKGGKESYLFPDDFGARDLLLLPRSSWPLFSRTKNGIFVLPKLNFWPLPVVQKSSSRDATFMFLLIVSCASGIIENCRSC